MGTADKLRLLSGRVGEGGRREVGDWGGDGGKVCGDDAFLKNGNGIRDLRGG